MRVVFSRKGFDSAAGGCPSPIIEGKPTTIPIPTVMPTPMRYQDLKGEYGRLVEDLTNRRIKRTTRCHVDPDINQNVLGRLPGWRGAFGQTGAAQSHLNNQGVVQGDLFLFWGLFQCAAKGRRWKFNGPKQHRIFGWLQIGQIFHVGADGRSVLRHHTWLRDHPHTSNGWSHLNTIYVAADQLTLNGRKTGVPGWGMFSKGFRLSEENSLVSNWQVPNWLNPARGGVGMSYHPLDRWSGKGTVRSAARGQEFVADTTGRRDALEWLEVLFHESQPDL
ncbi:MAG: hypothetical protein WCA78_09600 [Rhizomicrobium sp.]